MKKIIKKIPKPKIGDIVEMYDMSKVCGNVVEIVSNSKIKIQWDENKFSVEKINDIALVDRY